MKWWRTCSKARRSTGLYLWTELAGALGAEPCTAFCGGGYRLGAAPEEQSAYVAGERRPSDSSQDVHVVLKLWKSGFSLDNGDLRNYSDPKTNDPVPGVYP
uniref:SEP domain-containing protein n=1 Tax=Anguilla anguilla TaxID=7936 RepID=A0A0E9QQF7_ANGAN